MKNRLKIGIYCAELPKNGESLELFDFYGFSLPTLLFSTPRERRKVGQLVCKNQSSIVLLTGQYFDRYTDAILELGSDLPILSVIAPASKISLSNDPRTNSIQRLSSSAPNTQLWISGNKSNPDPRDCIDPKHLPEKIRLTFDPFWYLPKFPLEAPAVFHIHGWHTERWVRKYGKTGLLALKKMVNRHHPESILFSHSQRLEEAIQFAELIRNA